MDAPPALPRDERLPQLARAVDPLAMQQVFAAALRDHHGQHVTACAVDRIKYRPGRNCTVSYRLTIRDERQACSYEQRVAGRFCAAGDAVRRHARHRSRLGLASRCGVPALLVPSLELFAWFLPNDPELAALPALLATARDGGSALSEAIAVMTGGVTRRPNTARSVVAASVRASMSFSEPNVRSTASVKSLAVADSNLSGPITSFLKAPKESMDSKTTLCT